MLTPPQITRLEKTARDNGFELVLPPEGPWLAFASSQTPLSVWLTANAEKHFFLAFTHEGVATELSQHRPLKYPTPPPNARHVLSVPDIPALDRLLRRVFQLSRTLPDELLHLFERQTADLPQTTEIERLTIQRVGQNLFRSALRNYWHDRCAITHLAIPELLRASHIKPWADCESNAERLDVYNGLLLSPHFDAAFDKGFLTVEDDGQVVLSAQLSEESRIALGLNGKMQLERLRPEHAHYLAWHRSKVFRG